MTYGEKVLSRLSVPGVALLAVGAALGFGAERLCRQVFRDDEAKARKWAVPLKIGGLVMALVGALILLDVFPNL